MDASGNWPQLSNKQKIAVGLAVIAVAAVLTVATAGAAGPEAMAAVHCFAMGALEGSIMGAASGAVSGAAMSGGIAFVTSGGDLEKTKQAAIDGACDGFMSGSITGFITGGMNSPHCFVAGTVVLTAAGKKGIEHIREGDLVLSEDPDTGEVTYKRVLETYVSEATELIHLNIDGEEIITTPAHPFYVKDKGFVLAGNLEVGTTLIDNEGNELHLQIVRWEQLQNPVPVYNFAVEDFHTYFVGNNKTLVHNVCGTESVCNGLEPNQGYSSFRKLKKAIGSPGEGKHWHHIVEQSQINKSGFSSELINNTDNIFALDAATHAKVTGYYNRTTLEFTHGLSVRNWLSGLSFQEQYDFGVNVLRSFGVIPL